MESSVKRERSPFLYVVIATTVVGIMPLLAVYAFEAATGITSAWIGAGLGVVLSALLAIGGAAFWRRFGRTDLVFSDLLIWGYIRHIWVGRRLGRMNDQLDELLDASLTGLSREERVRMLADFTGVMEATDPYTRGHSRRVTNFSYMIAKTMGLRKSQIEDIRTAAAVHDIGKIHVPQEILNKPDRLTDEEFSVIKEHPGRGAEMVRGVLGEHVSNVVLHHHERIDGRGYPQGLVGDEIPLESRVIAVADTFDALTSTRAYRPAARHRKAIGILKSEAGKQLDANAVNAFLKYYSGRGSLGFWATVTTVPQRLLESALNWLRQVALSGVVQTAAAVGTSVAVVSSVPGIMPTPAPQPSVSAPGSRVALGVDVPVPSPSPAPPPETMASTADGSGAPSRRTPSSSSSSTPSPEPSPPPGPGPEPSPSPPPNDPDLLGEVGEVVEAVVELVPS